jgi:hypothetical protein
MGRRHSRKRLLSPIIRGGAEMLFGIGDGVRYDDYPDMLRLLMCPQVLGGAKCVFLNSV